MCFSKMSSSQNYNHVFFENGLMWGHQFEKSKNIAILTILRLASFG